MADDLILCIHCRDGDHGLCDGTDYATDADVYWSNAPDLPCECGCRDGEPAFGAGRGDNRNPTAAERLPRVTAARPSAFVKPAAIGQSPADRHTTQP